MFMLLYTSNSAGFEPLEDEGVIPIARAMTVNQTLTELS